MTPPKGISMIKTRFAYGFLRALKSLRLRNNRRPRASPSSPRESFRRYRMVKLAADASMASAVGSRRAWSRAMLWKIRYQAKAKRHALATKRRTRTRRSSSAGSVRRSRSGKGCGGGGGDRSGSRTGELRKLVPGGEGMEVGRLLDETAHYIKCLSTQVLVMTNILDFCSSTSTT